MPPVKVAMDKELYKAAEEVMDAIEAKIQSNRNMTPDEILGRPLAAAYARWQSMLITKFLNAPDFPPFVLNEKPTKKGHPWGRKAVLPKRRGGY